jgi:hypothetical protein
MQMTLFLSLEIFGEGACNSLLGNSRQKNGLRNNKEKIKYMKMSPTEVKKKTETSRA